MTGRRKEKRNRKQKGKLRVEEKGVQTWRELEESLRNMGRYGEGITRGCWIQEKDRRL